MLAPESSLWTCGGAAATERRKNPAIQQTKSQLLDAQTSISEIAASLGVGRSSIYRWLAREQSKAA